MATSSIANKKITLGAAVAAAGTVVTSYPAGQTQATLQATTGGSLALETGETFKQAASGAGTVLFAFGASDITITNNSGAAWPAGTDIFVSFGQVDINGSYNLTNPKKVQDSVA